MANCNHLILTCMDFRLQTPVNKWLDDHGYTGDVDRIAMAGSCKDPDLAIENIKVGCDLHGVKDVVISQHDDCGAYGGQAAFDSLEALRTKLKADMDVLRDRILERWPDVKVTRLYMEQDGDAWKLIEI